MARNAISSKYAISSLKTFIHFDLIYWSRRKPSDVVKKPEQAIFFRRLKREHPIYNKGGQLVDGYPLITSTNPLSEKNQLIANIKVSQRPVRSGYLS